MKKIVAVAVCFSISGCGMVTVKPNQAEPVPHASQTMNLKVAVASEGSSVAGEFYVWSPRFAQTASGTIAPGIPQRLADAFRQTGAFRDVYFPAPIGRAADQIDLFLSGRMALNFTADPAWAAKAFLTGFTLFLLSPVLIYGDHYNATGDLSVRDGDNREIRRYNESYQVEMTHLMILPGQADDMLRQGADVAINGLAAKLAGDIVRDLSQLKEEALASSGDDRPRRRRAKDEDQDLGPATPPSAVAQAPAAAPQPMSSYNGAPSASALAADNVPEPAHAPAPAAASADEASAELLP